MIKPRFVRDKKDFRSAIKMLPKSERSNFLIENASHLLPFNPGVMPNNRKPRICFFGWAAYSTDKDLEDWKSASDSHFLAEIADKYYTKLCNVTNMYREGVNPEYMQNGSVYFTNYVKFVLREEKNDFSTANAVQAALRKSPKTIELMDELARQEVENLKSRGCRVFVCYGNNAYDHLTDACPGTKFFRNRHFSRYWISQSSEVISEINSWLKRA